MTEYFRRKVIWLFVEKELINEEFARNLLSWRYSGFGAEESDQIADFDPLPDADPDKLDRYKRAWARLLAKVYEVDPLIYL
ncbi:MAG: hypothetical protein AB1798_14660 [Spirochaetota bacterium]